MVVVKPNKPVAVFLTFSLSSAIIVTFLVLNSNNNEKTFSRRSEKRSLP